MNAGHGNRPLATSVGQALPHPRRAIGPAGQHGVCHGPISYARSCAVSRRGLCRRVCHRACRFCLRDRRSRGLAAFYGAGAGDALDHRVRPHRQGVSVWKLRRAIQWKRLMPFLVGGVIGVPIGAELLRWASPGDLRLAVGAILVLFSLWNLFRPSLASMARAGIVADGAVGLVNGIIGGSTGLAGIAAVIWCSLRGWPPAEQRAVFQPAGVAVFAMSALWLGGAGMIGGDTLILFLIGLPALALGTWAGLQLFGKLDDQAFRRIVLVLLLISGASLLVLGR